MIRRMLFTLYDIFSVIDFRLIILFSVDKGDPRGLPLGKSGLCPGKVACHFAKLALSTENYVMILSHVLTAVKDESGMSGQNDRVQSECMI